MNTRQFETLCKAAMRELADEFGFRPSWRRGDSDVIRVAFQNATTRIVFHLEVRDCHVFLEVAQLADGEIPSFPRPVRPDSQILCFDFDNVLLLRSPDSISPSVSEEFVAIDSQVHTQVKSLLLHGRDLLVGNFSVLTEVDRIIKDRAREFAFSQFGEKAREFGWE
jgi:hypothetical protein